MIKLSHLLWLRPEWGQSLWSDILSSCCCQLPPAEPWEAPGAAWAAQLLEPLQLPVQESGEPCFSRRRPFFALCLHPQAQLCCSDGALHQDGHSPQPAEQSVEEPSEHPCPERNLLLQLSGISLTPVLLTSSCFKTITRNLLIAIKIIVFPSKGSTESSKCATKTVVWQSVYINIMLEKSF